MYAYDHLTDPQNTGSGITPHVWLAPIGWLAEGGIKKPVADGNPGGEVTITANHTFKPGGYGFIKFLLSPEKNAYTAEAIGDKGHQKFNHTARIFIPGSYEEVHEQLKLFKNVPLLALVRDASCHSNMHYQLGDGCMSAWLSTQFATGTTVDGVKGYETTITYQSDYITLYLGAVPLAAPMLPTPQLSLLADHEEYSLDWPAVTGATSYQLVASKNADLSNPALSTTVGQVGSNANNFTANWDDLPTSGTWYFGLVAIRADGTSRPSRRAVVSIARPAQQVLPSPTGLTVGSITQQGATFNCTHSNTATAIRLQVFTNAGFTGSPVVNLTAPVDAIFSPTDTDIILVNNLTANTQYWWRVRAEAAGFTESNWANAANPFTTQA